MTDEQEQKAPLNMATSALLGGLAAIKASVDKIWQGAERREQRSPGRFIITQDGSQIYRSQSLGLRILNWVCAVDAAGTYQLRAGSSEIATIVTAAAGTLVIPLEVTIMPGLDLSTVETGGGAGVVVSSYVVAYTEGD